MERKKWTWRLLIATALGSAIAGGTAMLPSENLLLERANKVADVRGWWVDDFPTRDIQWVSDTVLFTGTGDWRLKQPFLYNILTRRKSPLTRLSNLLEKDNDMGTNSWELSPDKQWLLWTMELYEDVRVARLDGSGFQTIALPPPGNTIGKIGWDKDSRHWKAVGFDYASSRVTNLGEGNVRTPGKWHSLALSGEADFFDADALHVDKQSNSVAISLSDANAATLHTRNELTLHPPKDTQIIDVVRSNGGNQLAWLLRSTRTPLLARWLHRFLPRFAPLHSSVEIRLSGLDGNDMRELGHVEVTDDLDETGELANLQWLPSDESLSFLYQGSLWTLPVK